MPKIDFDELSSLLGSVSSERRNNVNGFKQVTAGLDSLNQSAKLSGQGWSSSKAYMQAYNVLSEALFNIFYELDNAFEKYLKGFVSEVGRAESTLNTDELEDLLRELQLLMIQKADFLSDFAEAFKDVPFLGNFFMIIVWNRSKQKLLY